MDMMTITQLAQQTDLAPPTVRRYLDDFILYVPSVRVDGTIGFPPEAITVINTIHALMERGHSHSEILAKLEDVYPITVISAQPLVKGESIPSSIPAITSLLQTVDERYGALTQEIGHLRSDIDSYTLSGPLAHVPSELAQIRQVISMLAKRVADTKSTANPELSALHLELAELRAAVQDNWASAPSLDMIPSLKNEVALLKQQLTELRNERGQVLALMTNLQDTIQQLREERMEGFVAMSSGPAPTQLFSLGNSAPSSHTNQRAAAEPTNSGRRTPRRLGHTTAR
jgi:DNA-binding transcriptional MerR regulator